MTGQPHRGKEKLAAAERRLTTSFPSDIQRQLAEIEHDLGLAVDEGERGSLLLGRALILQGAGDPRIPAADATQALGLLRSAGRSAEAALAAGTSAGMVFRTGDIETAVDRSVEAMLLLHESDDSALAARASNAISVLFLGFSAFEFADEYSRRALELLGEEQGHTRDIVCYSNCMIAAESGFSGLQIPLDTAFECAEWLRSSSDDEISRRVLGPGMLGELSILAESENAASIELDADVADLAAPRLASWYRLLLATVLHARGDAAAALATLDVAIPQLAEVRDEHRLVRAYSLRSRVRRALGDLEGALDDANERGDVVRSWHVTQVGRLSVQIVRRAELERSRTTLLRQATELAAEMEVDPLTGVGSRRLLDMSLDGLANSGEGAVAIVMIDLDHFKRINDTFGHSAGDEVLRRVGLVLSSVVRDHDLVARLGGEEFVVVLQGAAEAQALSYADRIRNRLVDTDWGDIAPGLTVRASAGVATGDAADVRDVMVRADAALYEAKRQGRNRSVAA